MWEAAGGSGSSTSNSSNNNPSIPHLTKHHLLRALPEHCKTFLHAHKTDKTQLSSKLQQVHAFIVDRIKNNNKKNKGGEPLRIVVFSQWCGSLDLVESLIETYFGSIFQILRIDGSTPGQQRAICAKKFNNEDSSSPAVMVNYVLLLNYKAAGEGLNLQSGQYVLLLDPWFTPSVEDQAVARVIRPGNHNEIVTVIRFQIDQSIEQRVQAIADRKREESTRLLSLGLQSRAKMVQSSMQFSKEELLHLVCQ